MSKYLIRPHHLLCMSFFEGKGYSREFTENTEKLLLEFECNPKLQLINSCDVFCSSCPHNGNGICKTVDKVNSYDEKVLDFCDLEIGENYFWSDLKKIAKERIIDTGSLAMVCGDCQWYYICSAK